MQWSDILEAMTFYHSIDSGKLDQRNLNQFQHGKHIKSTKPTPEKKR